MLTLDYRPTTFSDVVGQSHVIPLLQRFALTSPLHAQCLIFAGSHGTGKTSVARILAAALNCETQSGDACTQCDSCKAVADGSSDTVIEIDAASRGGVADVHQIRDMCLYATLGRVRVFIVDEAQLLTPDAQGAFLKLLEEPPADTLFLLLTTDVDKIRRPVRSRAMPFEFKPVHPDLVIQRLSYIAKDIEFDAQPELVSRIALDTHGHVRDAVTLLDQCRLADVTTVEMYEKFFGVVSVALPILDHLTRGDLHAALHYVQQFFESSTDLRVFAQQLTDALVAVATASVGAEAPGSVLTVSQRVSRDRVLSALHVVWDFSGRIQWAPNDRSQADLVVVMLGKVLAPEVVGTVVPEEDMTILTTSDPDEFSVDDAVAFLQSQGLA